MRTSDPGFETPTLNPHVLRPDEIQYKDRLGYKVVVRVDAHSWTAYKGPTGWSDVRVELEGDALDEKTACGLFPMLADSDFVYYR